MYDNDIQEDAVNMFEYYNSDFKQAVVDDKDFMNIDEFYDWLHEEITDRSYTLQDAAVIIDECTNEETDWGLWESIKDPEDAIKVKAAYSYANDVQQRVNELYDELRNDYIQRIDDAIEVYEEDHPNGDDNPEIDHVIDDVWADFMDQFDEKQRELDCEKELYDLNQWIALGNRTSGFRTGYPFGDAYIDARCGSGHGMPTEKAYIDFDNKIAKWYPTHSGKHKADIMKRITELEVLLNA